MLVTNNQAVQKHPTKPVSTTELLMANIFTSSCIEATARKVGCSTGEMYRRMKRVGLIAGFILPGYEGLHTQSRDYVTDIVLSALNIWEAKQAKEL